MLKLMCLILLFMLGVALLALTAAIIVTWKHCDFRIVWPRFWLLPNKLRIHLHGPVTWRWWQFIAIRARPARTTPPTTGTSFIIYTRWGWTYIDFIFVR
jgi:hypothetical protein